MFFYFSCLIAYVCIKCFSVLAIDKINSINGCIRANKGNLSEDKHDFSRSRRFWTKHLLTM